MGEGRSQERPISTAFPAAKSLLHTDWAYIFLLIWAY